MTEVLFYRREPGGEAEAPVIAEPMRERVWRPAVEGFPPAGSRSLRNFVWWVFTKLNLFDGPDFAELTIWRERHLLHRLIATPRWLRFPFMGRDDVQVGDLWTAPDARRQGIASLAIARIHALYGRSAHAFWYVVEADNTASARLAEACGYRLVGKGRRTSPLGLRFLGQYRLDERADQRGRTATDLIAPF